MVVFQNLRTSDVPRFEEIRKNYTQNSGRPTSGSSGIFLMNIPWYVHGLACYDPVYARKTHQKNCEKRAGELLHQHPERDCKRTRVA
jgi:hypothetical protein